MDLTTRAEQVPNLPRYSGGKEQRTPAQYTADLTVETERSLRRSPSWRAGRPLADHRGECDCPTLTGCVERRAWPSSNDLGGRSEPTPNVAGRNAERDRETARLRTRQWRERRRNGGQP